MHTIIGAIFALIALATQGTDTALMTPEQAGAYVRNQIAKWTKVVEATGMRAD